MNDNKQQTIQGMSLNTFVGLMNILFVVPSVGWIISIVFWAIGKDQSEYVNVRGKDMLNWFLSLIIFSVAGSIAGTILTIIIPVIGGIAFFILFAIVGIYSVVCPIIAGVKAFNGEDWRYPYTFQLIK